MWFYIPGLQFDMIDILEEIQFIEIYDIFISSPGYFFCLLHSEEVPSFCYCGLYYFCCRDLSGGLTWRCVHTCWRPFGDTWNNMLSDLFLFAISVHISTVHKSIFFLNCYKDSFKTWLVLFIWKLLKTISVYWGSHVITTLFINVYNRKYWLTFLHGRN